MNEDTSVLATVTFKLILECNNSEFRFIDIKHFLQNDKGKLVKIYNDINMFKTAMLDRNVGTFV